MVWAVGLAAVTIVAPPAAAVTGQLAIGAISAIATGGTATASMAVGSGVALAATTGGAAALGATGSTIVGAAAATTGGLKGAVHVAMGPVGWVMLGASEYNWTCWKQIIHDESKDVNGVPLSFIMNHKNVKTISKNEENLIIENIWDEKFKINFLKLDNMIAAHAEKC